MLDANLEALLDLFNLEADDVQSFYSERDQERHIFTVVLEPVPEECPTCHSNNCIVHSYVNKRIKHQTMHHENTIMLYKARRYICKDCGRTFYEHNPFVHKGRQISALTVVHILEDLRNYNETFTSVARRYHVSPTTAANIFDTHVEIPRQTLPKYLNFDEVYAFTSKQNGYQSKYVCVLFDYERQAPTDILPARTVEYLSKYFSKIPIEERRNVELCCTDMYKGYRTIIHSYLPNSLLAVDRFHVCQEMHRNLQQVRIRIMKGHNTKDIEYYLLKKFNWMLYRHLIPRTDRNNPDKKEKDIFDIGAKKYFNKRLNKYVNFYDIRKEIEKIPELKAAWDLKDKLDSFYEDNTYETAPAALKDLIKEFKNSKTDEMKSMYTTLNNWKVEIINSFLVVDIKYKVNKESGEVTLQQTHMSNAIIENRNAIIKCVKKNANGYRNWPRFRNRLMFVLDKESVYSLNPMYRSKQIKEKKENNERKRNRNNKKDKSK